MGECTGIRKQCQYQGKYGGTDRYGRPYVTGLQKTFGIPLLKDLYHAIQFHFPKVQNKKRAPPHSRMATSGKNASDVSINYSNSFQKREDMAFQDIFSGHAHKKFIDYRVMIMIDRPLYLQKMHDFLLKKRKNNIYFFSKIYNTIQASSTIHSFLNSKKIMNVASKLIGCKPEQIITTSYQLRIDAPNDKKHRFDWHYDLYKYRNKINFTKKSGIVFWIPLQDVNKKNGTIEYLKNSYKIKKGSKGIQKNDQAFKITQSLVNNMGKELVNASFGDLFIQSYLMLHQSGFNMSNRIRFSLIGRYINIEDKNFKGCKKSMELLDLY